MIDPRAEYTHRIARWNAEIARGDRRYLQISNWRLADFAAAAIVGWFVMRGAISGWWMLPFVLAFVTLVVAHNHVARQNDRARRLRQLSERGLARLDGTWAGAGPDGARFLDEHHPFARDLDLFGPASLFQLLDTATTEIGEETLADWLTNAAPLDEIRLRQTAVEELRPMADYREAMAIIAAGNVASRTGPLAEFAAAPPIRFSVAARAAFVGLAVISAVLTIAWASGRLPLNLLVAWALVQSGLVLPWRRQVARALARIDVATSDLSRLKSVLARIEAQSFTSPRLVALRDALNTEGLTPSQTIRRLERLVSILDSCRNQMFMPIAALFLVRSQVAVAIDRWHARHGAAIPLWLRAVGELEALSALATYAFEHPADPFPAMLDSDPTFDAEDLAHPLLLESIAVRNDVRLGASHPHVLIVSGSNMSGKSTLLRAVGVNVVLAQAGAPVRATRLRLSRLALGATLRIEDSLHEGHSRFYAEILRLRAIVDIARGPLPLLFLLDEILGGTNSHDRRLGAEAVVKRLADLGAIGLVTTHDLALTELVPALGSRAANVHFEDHLEAGKLVFDYRMRPGVIERGNALALMQAIGLIGR